MPTFDWLAAPRRGDLVYGICDGPVLVAHLDQSYRNLGRVPGGLEDIGTPSRYGVVLGCAHHDRLRADGCEAIDVRAQMELDDVALGEGLF